MNYGLYLSAGGALTSLHRQDVIANNLANLDTVGFKPDLVVTRQRLPERLESATFGADPQWLLERLGGGQFVEPTRVQLIQGALTPTGNEMDLAIRGDGFFVIDAGQGSGDARLRFSRDGRLTLNDRQELIMAANGLRVLDTQDQPIHIAGTGPVRIDAAGTITQDGRTVARMQIVDPPDPSQVRKTGHNLLRARDGVTITRTPASGEVRQGFTEASAVDPIMALNAMISATKAVQSNIKMMQYHDHILGQTINTFGRVA